MAEEHHKTVESGEEVEVRDRGLFDFMGKKQEERHEDVLVTGVENIHIVEGKMVEEKKEEEEEEKKKEGFVEKLHRSHSSSSSSDEEEVEGENKEKEKKKKKRGLKEKIKEKLHCEKKEDEEEAMKKSEAVLQVEEEEEEVAAAAVVTDGDDTSVVVEKFDGNLKPEDAPETEEKKGFLEKIKEKLPGHKKPAEEAPAPAAACEPEAEGHEGKEKKGILGKIMEKLPGYHKAEEEEKKNSTPTQ